MKHEVTIKLYIEAETFEEAKKEVLDALRFFMRLNAKLWTHLKEWTVQ